jgi:hypothetical protein
MVPPFYANNFFSAKDDLSGCTFHPLDNHLLITFGKGSLTFWTLKKDGFFERTDMMPSEVNRHFFYNIKAMYICTTGLLSWTVAFAFIAKKLGR